MENDIKGFTAKEFLAGGRRLYESYINGDDPVIGEIPRSEVMTLGFGLACWVPYVSLQDKPEFDNIKKELDVVSVKTKESGDKSEKGKKKR